MANPSTAQASTVASWIGFARYKLTKWVNLQAEYIHTISENQLGQRLFDNAGTVGATFFW